MWWALLIHLNHWKLIWRAEGRFKPSKFHSCFMTWERKEWRWWEVIMLSTITSSFKIIRFTLFCLACGKFWITMNCPTGHVLFITNHMNIWGGDNIREMLWILRPTPLSTLMCGNTKEFKKGKEVPGPKSCIWGFLRPHFISIPPSPRSGKSHLHSSSV